VLPFAQVRFVDESLRLPARLAGPQATYTRGSADERVCEFSGGGEFTLLLFAVLVGVGAGLWGCDLDYRPDPDASAKRAALGGLECGDGVCGGAEHCLSCPADCGACAQDCCGTSTTAGCDQPDVQACVCGTDPWCCDHYWDGICVSEVSTLGCSAICSCGNGTCEAWEDAASCEADCGPHLSDCCETSTNPGCDPGYGVDIDAHPERFVNGPPVIQAPSQRVVLGLDPNNTSTTTAGGPHETALDAAIAERMSETVLP